jgi:hypothetical protein
LADEGTQSEVSIGGLFEQLETIRAVSLQAAKKSTEFYEKDIALQLHDLGNVVADMLYLIQEHLSCHDCKVVDHTHQGLGGRGRVWQVFELVAERGGEDASSEA